MIENPYSPDRMCPRCLLPEVDEKTQLLNFRGCKVENKGWWWSHCLKCDSWYKACRA